MKNLIKMFAGGLTLSLALASVPVQSHATSSSVESATAINKFPSANTGVHDKLEFYGMKPLRITTHTTGAQLLHVGAIFLDAICPWGGTLGKYSLALDSGANSAGLTFDSIALAASPNVYIDSASSGSLGSLGKNGCWVPPFPVKLANGLVGVQNDTAHQTLFYVHCSDGTNPCVP